jgi:hypothetical protein
MTVRAEEEPAPLTERERAVLDFEGSWWREHIGTKKQTAISRALGISSSRYYTLLMHLVERQEAFRYDPLVVARLRRRRRKHVADLLGAEPDSSRRP